MLAGRAVTVAGAGIAGLTSAIALAQRGAAVRVLEQAGAVGEVGAGLQIAPNGVAVLDALGLGAGLRAAAVQADVVVLRDYRRGTRVTQLDLSRSGGGRPYLLLHRADLIGLLAAAATSAGVEILPDRAVISLSETDAGADIAIADGGSERADLLIGADGLHSRLRPVLNGGQAPFFTGQVAWRALVAGAGPQTVNLYMGLGRHVVTYPLRGGTLTNIVAVEERNEWTSEGWHHAGDPDALRRGFSAFCPEVRALLGRVETTNLWGLFRHPVAKNWHGNCSALVGDAAHPTLPFLAQGANMALEDAWVLADCLHRLPMARALAVYQKTRHARVVRVVNAATANARNYHLRNPVLRVVAHSGLRGLGLVAPGRLVGKFSWLYDHDVTAGAAATG